MRNRILALTLGSSFVIFLAGCQEVPHQLIHDTKVSLEEAQKSGAETYAPAPYKAALVSYELAKKEIYEENRKLPFMKKYQKATETMKSALHAAQSAKVAAEATKTRIKSETEEIAAKAVVLLDSAAIPLGNAAVKKKKDAVLTITAQIDSVKAIIDSVKISIASGDLLAAKEKVAPVMDLAQKAKANAEALVPAKKMVAKKK
jgi:hypothetical protein